MKIQITDQLSHDRTLSRAPGKNRIGVVVVLLAVFLCSFAASASTQWTQVKPSATLTEIAASSKANLGGLNSGKVYLDSTTTETV
jgi:hypothetical protein